MAKCGDGASEVGRIPPPLRCEPSHLKMERKKRSKGGASLDFASPANGCLSPDKIRLFKQIGVFVLAYTSYCSLYSARKPLSIVKGILKEEGHTMSTLAKLDTAFLSSYALGQIVIPTTALQYADPPLILLLAFLGSGMCCLIFGLSRQPNVMVATWILAGLFHSVVYPICVRVLGVWFDPSVRGRVLGSWTTSQQTGSLAATAFATYTARHYGWRYAFYLPGILVAMMGVIVYVALPREGGLPGACPKVEGSPKTPPARMRVAVEEKPPPHSASLRSNSQMVAMMRGGTWKDHMRPASTEMSPLSTSNRQSSTMPPSYSDEAFVSRPSFVADKAIAIPYSAYSRYSEVSLSSQMTTGRLSKSVHFNERRNFQNERLISIESEHHLQPIPLHVSVNICRILNISDLKTVALAFFLIKCVRYSFLFWLPFFLEKGLGYNRSTAGYGSMLFDIGGIPGAVFTGFLSDRILNGKRLQAASIMTVVSSVSILAFLYASFNCGFTAMLFCMFAVGFCVAGPDSILGAAAAQDLCDRSPFGILALSSAASVVNGMGSIGAAVQSLMTNLVVEVFGWKALYYTLSILMSCSMMLLWTTLKRERRFVNNR